MKLYNSLTRKIEHIKPIKKNRLGFYACGMTVYDYTHLGHLRKYCMDDIMIRTLRHAGYQVKFVQNITDVGHLTSDADTGEDKLEKGARKYHQNVWQIAQKFEDYFFYANDLIGNLHPDISCRATDHIKEQIELVKSLIKKKYSYVINQDGIYFDTSKFKDYGKLANLNKSQLKEGARVAKVAGKKNATDFALWKFDYNLLTQGSSKRQMSWWFAGPLAGQLFKQQDYLQLQEKLNKEKRQKHPQKQLINLLTQALQTVGFPGWHIECSAMSMKYLGQQFDIHTGGKDHIEIHHPNEIAQSEAATGKKPFVRYWIHHNFLRVDGKKMSKSLGNFYTLDDVLKKGYSPQALRLLFLTAHYRSELNFTWKSLAAAEKSWQRLVEQVRTLKKTLKSKKSNKAQARAAITAMPFNPCFGCPRFAQCSPEQIKSEWGEERISDEDLAEQYRQNFFAQLENDLDTASALALIWELLKDQLYDQYKYQLIQEFDQVLGLGLAKIKSSAPAKKKITMASLPKKVTVLIKKRHTARQNKAWQQADQLRKQLQKLKYEVTDMPDGKQEIKKLANK